MKQFLTILTLFISSFAIGQATMRTPGTNTVWDGKLITVQSFAIPKTTLGGNLNGGIPDSLGYIVLSKGDSSVYVYYAANKWKKIGNDSAYINARFDTAARTLTLYRINKDSTILLIPAGSGSGSGATDYSWSVVGNTVSQLWNNGANHSFDKSDSRISSGDITNWNGKLNPSDTTGKWVPLGRNLTINGVTQSLAANRTWNVGTLVGADTTSKWVPLGRTLTINGITQDLSVDRTFTIPNTGVTSISATAPIIASASTGNVALSMATSGITAGTYPKATYNAFGVATSGSNLSQIDVTTGLGFLPLNPVAYPVNLGGETLQSVTTRGGSTTNQINSTNLIVINDPGYLLLLNPGAPSLRYSLANDGNGMIGYEQVANKYLFRATIDSFSVNRSLYVNGPTIDTSLRFHVFGNGRISGTAFLGGINVMSTGSVFFGMGSPAAGKVLTSDATGFASWQTPTLPTSATLQAVTTNGNTATNNIILGSTSSSTANSYQLQRQVSDVYTGSIVLSNIAPATVGLTFNSIDVTTSTSTYLGLPANPSNGPYYAPNSSTVYRLLHQNNVTQGTGISIANTALGISVTNTGVTSYNGSTGAITQPTLNANTYSSTVGTVSSNFNTVVVSEASYIRVGNIVHVAAYITFNATTTAQGDIAFALPFTAANSAKLGAGVATSTYVNNAYVRNVASTTNATLTLTPTQTGAIYAFIQYDYVAQ